MYNISSKIICNVFCRFLKPAEIEEMLDKAGMGTKLVQGMSYIPGNGDLVTE